MIDGRNGERGRGRGRTHAERGIAYVTASLTKREIETERGRKQQVLFPVVPSSFLQPLILSVACQYYRASRYLINMALKEFAFQTSRASVRSVRAISRTMNRLLEDQLTLPTFDFFGVIYSLNERYRDGISACCHNLNGKELALSWN